MAETTIENQICKNCGADVRKDALFCYHCGSQVADEIVLVHQEEIKLQENQSNEFVNKITAEPSEKPEKYKTRQIVADKAVEPPADSNLKSAAAMRKKPKSVQPKKIEIIWEERENTPNSWFILVAVFLTIVAGVILFLAIRMR